MKGKFGGFYISFRRFFLTNKFLKWGETEEAIECPVMNALFVGNISRQTHHVTLAFESRPESQV